MDNLEKTIDGMVIVAPWELRPRLCCLGHVSLFQAVFMVGTSELFIIAFLALYFAPTVLNDGYFFFTTELEGHGYELGFLFVIVLLISVIVVVLLLLGAVYRVKFLLIPHIFWQAALLIAYSSLIYCVMIRIEKVDYNPARNKIPFPSAVVLITVLVFASLLDVWWFSIVVEAVLRMRLTRMKTSVDAVEKPDET